jgi:hypothetical protein
MKTRNSLASLYSATVLDNSQLRSIRGGSEQKFGKIPFDEDILLPDPEPDPETP